MKEQLTKKVEIKNDQNGGCESKDTNHVMMVIIEKMAVQKNSSLHQYELVFRSQSNLEQHTLPEILPLIIEWTIFISSYKKQFNKQHPLPLRHLHNPRQSRVCPWFEMNNVIPKN